MILWFLRNQERSNFGHPFKSWPSEQLRQMAGVRDEAAVRCAWTDVCFGCPRVVFCRKMLVHAQINLNASAA